METTIRINTELLNMDVLEGIKKMFPNKNVEITIQEEYQDLRSTDGYTYIDGDEDATHFILNRPALAEELRSRISEYERTKETISVKPEDLL